MLAASMKMLAASMKLLALLAVAGAIPGDGAIIGGSGDYTRVFGVD